MSRSRTASPRAAGVPSYSQPIERPGKTFQARADITLEHYENAELLLNAMPLTCHLWNRDFVMIDCNSANLELFKIKDKQEFMARFLDFSPEYQPNGLRSSETAVDYLKKAFSDGTLKFEWMHQLLDGTPVPCEMTLVRIRYGDDDIIAAYARDMREQKRMMAETLLLQEKLEVALKEAQNASRGKSEFLTNMSHEMRTPMNAIIGLSELLLGNEKVTGVIRDYLDKINSAGVTLLSIINDILDISKIESGKFEITPVVYDVPSIINDTITLNIIRIGEKPIEFKLYIDESLPSQLCGDDLRLKQIFNNLLSNAFKYTKEGIVEWHVSFKRDKNGENGWLTCKVKDTGIGIKPENIRKLFTDYNQVDTKSNREIEGTGLGLSLAKKLTEMMDGSISVESEYGIGTTFTIRVRQKAVTDTQLDMKTIDNLQSFHYSEGKRARNITMMRLHVPYARVLVVDDMRTNLSVADGILKLYGMQVDCMSGGQQAVDAIRDAKVRYNAIFMDHMMPGMDGIEATTIIREIDTDYARTIPIIALTANAIKGNAEMFISKGFQAFLSKPIDLQELDKVVRNFIRDKEQEKLLTIQQDEQLHGINSESFGFGNSDDTSNNAAWLAEKNVSGLDIKKGVENFGGDENVYLNILRTFADNTDQLLESIETFNKDKLNDYAITVHGIKGAGRGIYAKRIADHAEGLERAAKAGDCSYISENNEAFIDTTRVLIADIRILLSAADAKNVKPVKAEPDKKALSRLLANCQTYDIEGVDAAIADIERYQYESDGGLAEWLVENVKQMNFKQIIEKLSVA